jgi:hypothetical protein
MMSTQTSPLTYESILELFRETDRKFQETDRKFQETDRKIQESERKIQETWARIEKANHEIGKQIGKLSSSVGRLVENMVGGGNIVAQFQALGHNVITHCRNKGFGVPRTDSSGEIDLFLEDGDIAILIEVKTTLKTDDILEHIERIEKYRSWMDAKGSDKKRYIGAVAGASVADNVIKFAQKNGMYIIVQSGDAVEIVTPPEGFKAKEW